MTDRTIQRTVFPAERQLQPLYYRIDGGADGDRREPEFPDRFSARIAAGARLSTDTYFNTFFECHWRQYTRVGRLRLRLLLSGTGSVRLTRRGRLCGVAVLAAANFEGEDAEVILDVPDLKLHPREAGLLHFEVAARSDLLLRKADWLAAGVETAPVRIVVGWCTFDREPSLLRNVDTLLGDAEAAAAVSQVVVVDQGTRKVRLSREYGGVAARSGDKLRVVDQGNFGGAGGFTRAIIEAMQMPGATHALLMDDDIILEPESVFRAAAFLGLARGEVAVGAPMLDMLRPLVIYEAGGSIEPNRLCFDTPVRRRRVDTADLLEPLGAVAYTHYNAWWFFAVPLETIMRLGLPLPLFLRGDDAEFGYRLLRAGVPTVTLPGLGVWHEPFDLKNAGWQSYYDFRNRLVLAALHMPRSRWRLASAFLQRLGCRLLLLDYLQAALLCEAVADFCEGPGLLEAHPGAIHRKVMALQAHYPCEFAPRIEPLPVERTAEVPPSRARKALRLLRCLLRQVLRAGPVAADRPGAVLGDSDAPWHVLGLRDVVAVDNWNPTHYQVLRRSRARFLRLVGRGLKCAAGLCWGHRRVGDAWRAAAGRLSGREFWRRYLASEPDAPPVVRDGADRRAA